MILPILLTPEIKQTMPETIKVIVNFKKIDVIFPAIEDGGEDLIMTGDNAVVEGSEEDIIKWLKPFDGVAIGSECPQFEQFEIRHIGDNL